MDATVRVRDIARIAGVTERTTQSFISELVTNGYSGRHRTGSVRPVKCITKPEDFDVDELTEDLRVLLASLSGAREHLERSLTELRENLKEHSPFRYLMGPPEHTEHEPPG